jgi:hypothetical protein
MKYIANIVPEVSTSYSNDIKTYVFLEIFDDVNHNGITRTDCIFDSFEDLLSWYKQNMYEPKYYVLDQNCYSLNRKEKFIINKIYKQYKDLL